MIVMRRGIPRRFFPRGAARPIARLTRGAIVASSTASGSRPGWNPSRRQRIQPSGASGSGADGWPSKSARAGSAARSSSVYGRRPGWAIRSRAAHDAMYGRLWHPQGLSPRVRGNPLA